MKYEEKLIATELINSYKIHDPETGLMIWMPDTPDYVKKLETELKKAHLQELQEMEV